MHRVRIWILRPRHSTLVMNAMKGGRAPRTLKAAVKPVAKKQAGDGEKNNQGKKSGALLWFRTHGGGGAWGPTGACEGCMEAWSSAGAWGGCDPKRSNEFILLGRS